MTQEAKTKGTGSKTYDEYVHRFFPGTAERRQFSDIQPFRLGVTLARQSFQKHRGLLAVK